MEMYFGLYIIALTHYHAEAIGRLMEIKHLSFPLVSSGNLTLALIRFPIEVLGNDKEGYHIFPAQPLGIL
jgi:hypothetical protein